MFGLRTSVYKAVSAGDGRAYALRRVDRFRLTNEHAIAMVEVWQQIRHTNVVTFREAWTSKDFGERAMVFVYDYYPDAKTMAETYLATALAAVVPEAQLWSYAVQLVGAIAAVHAQGLALRTLVPSKLLLLPTGRLLVNCVGMPDILRTDLPPDLATVQRDDVFALGKLLVALSAAQLGPAEPAAALGYIEARYSPEWARFCRLLVSGAPNARYPGSVELPTAPELAALVAPHALAELNRAQAAVDMLEGELAKELENGRLFSLAAKLGMINERPPGDMPDPNWAETEDRYLLGLFRDYLFHQVDDAGTPVCDMGHIIETLNKLDIGSPDQIMLMSREV